MYKKLKFLATLLLLAVSVGAWANGMLVSELSSLSEGKFYIAAKYNDAYFTVPKTTISSQTFNCTTGTFDSETNTLEPSNTAGEFDFIPVSGVNNAFYIFNSNLNKYLVATGSKTFGYVDNQSSNYGYWTFSVVSSGGFSGQFSVKHSNKTHYMRAYGGDVKCYDGASNDGVYFFRIISETDYTITPTSNNNSWGTVSISNNIITATPVTGYRVCITNPYTVTSGSATVVQNGNQFSVTATENCTVQINFEVIPTYTVTLADDNTTLTETIGGVGVTLPSRDAIGSYTFAGWSETNVSNETTTAPANIIPTGAYSPTSDITLYPVYTKTEGESQETTTSTTIADYATTHSWANETKYSSVNIDNNVTATASGGANTGKYYTNGNNWRFYQNEDAKLTISTSSGTLNSIKLTFSVNNGGTLNYNNSTISSGSAVSVSGTSAEFTVSNSGTATNGQIRITAIEVIYTIGNSTTYYWSSPVLAVVERPVIEVPETFNISTTATITCATEDATIYYRYNENDEWTEYTAALNITTTTTIYAKAVKGTNESEVISKTTIKELASPIVTIDASGITNTNVFESTAAGSLSASVTYNDVAINSATVTWSGNNDEIATIDASTGVVTLIAAGTVTFTATYAGNADYNEATSTYEMNVTNIDPNAPGTENNPYTVAQAIAYINTLSNNTSSPNEVYVSGIISQIDSYQSNYHSITYWISDDGSTTSQMEVYSGLGLNGEQFSSLNDLQVGDIVTVKGTVKMYNNIPEFNYNSIITSFERPTNTEPSITIEPTSISLDADEHNGTLELAYENLEISDMTDFDIQYCDAEGNESTDTPDWLEVLVAEQDPQVGEGYIVSYIVDANTSEARTAYFKVFALGGEDYIYSNLVTINQAAYEEPFESATYTLASSIKSGKHYIIVGMKDSNYFAMGEQKPNNRAAVSVSVSANTATVESDEVYEFVICGSEDDGYTIYDERNNGYLYAASSSDNYLRTESVLDDNNNGLWSIEIGDASTVATIVAQGTNTRKNMRFNSSSSLFSCYLSGQGDVFLYEKVEQTPISNVKYYVAGTFTDWGDGMVEMTKNGNTYTLANQAIEESSQFKIVKVDEDLNSTIWYGGLTEDTNSNNPYTIHSEWYENILLTNSKDNGYVKNFKIEPAGTYTFTVDATNPDSLKLTVTGWPVPEYYLAGSWENNSWANGMVPFTSKGNKMYELVKEIDAGTEFKVVGPNNTWYSYNGTISRTNNTLVLSDYNGNMSISTAGTYTFILNTNNNTLTIAGWPVTAEGNMFVKVESDEEFVDGGAYLIVYENGNVALNGGLQNLDVAGNTIPVVISNGMIEANTTTTGALFLIEEGKITSASGHIIGVAGQNNGLILDAYATSSINSVSITDGNADIAINTSGTNYMHLAYNTTNNENRFRYFKNVDGEVIKPIQLYKLANTATITIAAACNDGTNCFGTYSNTSAFEVPAGMTISEIGIDNNGALDVRDYATGAVVPANTGVMVSAAAGGQYTVVLSNETGTSVLGTDNKLRPTGAGITATEMADADANCKFYRLTMHNGTDIGFWYGAADGAAFAVAANKAYLAVPQNLAKTGFAFGSGEATGIEHSTWSMEHDGNVYNMQGQRVSENYKGIVIVNGKKYINK